MAGLGSEDLGLIELQDAATIEEIMYYKALGLCPPGEGSKLIESGVTAISGRIPVNTSSGLISIGHPIGPSGRDIVPDFWPYYFPRNTGGLFSRKALTASLWSSVVAQIPLALASFSSAELKPSAHD